MTAARLPFAIAVGLAAVALVGGCANGSESRPVSDQAVGGRADGERPEIIQASPSPELLALPVPVNESQRLLELSRRTTRFCPGMDRLADIDEPNRQDVAELIRFATDYVKAARLIDPRSEVSDPTSRGPGGQTIRLPEHLLMALETEASVMQAFLVRVETAEDQHGDGWLSDSELEKRIEFAWLQLANSAEFIQAERTLLDGHRLHCQMQRGTRAEGPVR